MKLWKKRDSVSWEDSFIQNSISNWNPKNIFCFLLLFPKQILLDAGCGTGSHSDGFVDKTSWLVGLDLSKSALIEYRKRFGKRVSCILASLDYLPLRAECIDSCMLQDSLEHAENPLNTLIQLKSAIKSNGAVVATVPNWYNRILNVNPHNVKSHHYFSSSVGWKKLFKRAGFECNVSSIAFPILDKEFFSRNFHIFGVTVLLKAHKLDKNSCSRKKR